MQSTLFVPGLLLPGSVLRDTAFDLATPALALLLGRGRHAALAGLCALAARPCHAPPADFRPVAGATLARIDRLLMPARQRDAQAWRQALVDLERDWIAPALAALRRGGIGGLHLVASDAGERRTLGISLSRGALWRFWRRPRPLAALDVPT